MGNNPTTGKRKVSEDDESWSRGQTSGVVSAGLSQTKRKLIEKPSQESKREETIRKILTDKSIEDMANRFCMTNLNSESNRSASSGASFYPKSKAAYTMSQTVQKTLPTVFKWEGGGKEVYISGTFNNWKSKIQMTRSSENFYTIIDLPEGEHMYKFIIDGQWKIDTGQPLVTIQGGNVQNNVIYVKPTDFDVLKALSQDMANSKPQANQQAVSNTTAHQEQAWEHEMTLSVSSANSGGASDIPKPSTIPSGRGSPFSYSPPGEYTSKIPGKPFLQELNNEKPITPPLLPPQLLQIILNKDTSNHCDPNLLPNPNHVMVNHMYALSIKDGVIVLSAITRYRKKHVSTVIYKPI